MKKVVRMRKIMGSEMSTIFRRRNPQDHYSKSAKARELMKGMGKGR